MKNQLQIGDKCVLTNLKPDSAEKIKKLTARLYSENNADKFLNHFNKLVGEDNKNSEKLEQINFIVESFHVTHKTGTEYASCIVKCNLSHNYRIFVQKRYLKTVWRKHAHKLTSIFSDFWKPKTVKN